MSGLRTAWIAAHRPLRVVLTAALLCAAAQARAAEPDALEKQVADVLRPLYAEALARTGSPLKPGSPDWEASLAKTASAFLAARPDDCAEEAWLAATCGARSLITSSGSMEPTLDIGDTFLAVPPDERRPLRRGDVVTFRNPQASGAAKETIFISRLIGLPGERIALHHGIVSIDGTEVSREPRGGTVEIEGLKQMRFLEHLPGGRSYEIIRPATLPADSGVLAVQEDMPETVVPAGHYFMLGDNRLNAMDSRFAAFGSGTGIPADSDIVGIASLIYVSKNPARIGLRP